MVLWAWIGTLNLILLMVQDYTNKRLVDDRKNWLMIGVTIGLLHAFGATWWYLISLILLLTILRFFLQRFNAMGAADINTLYWVMLGYAIISVAFFLWFVGIFAVAYGLFLILKTWVFKYKKPVPAYYVLLLCFFLNNLIFGLY